MILFSFVKLWLNYALNCEIAGTKLLFCHVTCKRILELIVSVRGEKKETTVRIELGTSSSMGENRTSIPITVAAAKRITVAAVKNGLLFVLSLSSSTQSGSRPPSLG